MATLYERLPIAPDPSLQEPAGESELDSLSHRPNRFVLGTDWTMSSRGAPPACYEWHKIPNDTHFSDTHHLDYSAFDNAAATVSRSRSPSPASDDNHDYAFDGLHGTRKSTSPPTPEWDGSPETIGMFDLEFEMFDFEKSESVFERVEWDHMEELERASTSLPRLIYEAPPGDRLPPRRRRRLPGMAMIENEDEEEDTVIVSRSRGYFHLACPFYLVKPEKYKSCLLDSSLRSIEDVIRHLSQYDKELPYCPICQREFDSLGVRDQHVRARTCTVKKSGEVDDINERHQFWLHKGDAVHLGEQRRWSRIWERISPGALSLKPPYRYEIKDRAMPMINSDWGNADTIMSNEQPNDTPRLCSLILQIPGAVCGLAWGDSHNQPKKIKIQDIALGGRHRQPTL